MAKDNPFEQLGLNPRLNPKQLTQALQRRAERARPQERKRLQGLWRELTLKDTERVRWAFLTHPHLDDGASALDDLRKALPPHFSRYKPEPLTPRVVDALALPERPEGQALPCAPPLRLDLAPTSHDEENS